MTRDDEVFVNGVWKKYNNYINSNVKDIFFKKHQISHAFLQLIKQKGGKHPEKTR